MSRAKESKSNIKLSPSQKQKLLDLSSSYEMAEELMKEVEAFVDEAGIPAMNEMRYAGYHLLHSIKVEECEFCDEQLTSAINHCKRACYEAAEAGVNIALAKFGEFDNSYKDVVVKDVIENWVDIQKDFHKAQDDVNVARKKGDNRSDDYEIQMESFRKLKNHCNTMDCSRSDLNAKINSEIKASRRFVITSIIAILGIVAASIWAILALIKPIDTKTDIPASVSQSMPDTKTKETPTEEKSPK